MTSRRSIAASLASWILLLVTLLLAVAVLFGVPVDLELDSARVKPRGEYGYLVELPERHWPLSVVRDGPGAPAASALELFEDGRALGPAHMGHASIRSIGHGRYSHWQGRLVFSTSDNSDPRTNGRRYVAVERLQLAPVVLPIWLAVLAVAGAVLFTFWLRRGLIEPPDFALPAGLWAGAVLAYGIATRAAGIGLWLLVGLDVVLLVWAVATTRRTVARATGRSWKGLGAARNATLLAASLTLTVVAAEVLLMAWERRSSKAGPARVASKPQTGKAPARSSRDREHAGRDQRRARAQPEPIERVLESFGAQVPQEMILKAARRSALITLPPELERAPVEVEGAKRAYTWHGVLHVQDANNLRRTSPFPPRQERVFRVMLVGDSLTYGQGIDERWTYARQLEASLEPDYDVEVLNLGVSGHQSEDVLGKVRDFLPRLDPDLVIYGVCPNDFLPSGTGQYQNNYAYALPLPESVKTLFTDNSRLARLSEDGYNQALLRMGLRVDFFDDILNGFTGYQQRFAGDVTRMNELVTARGLPPVVALTLDQHPRVDSRGWRVAQVAERSMKDAGMDVIGMAPYYRQFEGQNFRVSRWEGHPNEVANAIWATMLDRHLRSLEVLRPFRKAVAEDNERVPSH